MAYDPREDRVLVYGGTDVDDFALGDVWSLSLPGEQWTELQPEGASPPPSGFSPSYRAAVDPNSGHLLLYDVSSHGMWALRPSDWPDTVIAEVEVRADGAPLHSGDVVAASPRILLGLYGFTALDTTSCRVLLDGEPRRITVPPGESMEWIELQAQLVPGTHTLEVRLYAASLGTITGTTKITFHVGSKPMVLDFRAGPVPSRGAIQFGFNLTDPASYTIDLFDLQGRKVARIADGTGIAGRNVYTWSGNARGRRLDSGLFFYVLTVQSREETIVRRGRIILLP